MSKNPKAQRLGVAPLLVVHPSPDLYGSDRMLVEVVRQMVEQHGDVVVALPGPGRLVPLLLEGGARVWQVPTLVLGRRLLTPSGWPEAARDALVGTLAALRTLYRLKPAAVYVNTLTLPLWPALARGAGVRTIVHVHEAEHYLPGPVRAAMTAPARFADQVLVNSRFTEDVVVRSFPGLRGRTKVVLNGVTGPRSPLRPPRVFRPVEPRILYVGRLSERKGLRLLVETVQLLEQRGIGAVLDLVGDVYPGYEWFEAELRQAVRTAGLQHRIRFRGFHTDVWPWLEQADVAVVPSVGTESFGNTAVEAVLAARPVVVADHSGLREAVEGLRGARLVDTRSERAAEKLAEALITVLENWPRHRAASLADEPVARARHRPDSFGRQVAEAVVPAGHRSGVSGGDRKAPSTPQRGGRYQQKAHGGTTSGWARLLHRTCEWGMRRAPSTSSTSATSTFSGRRERTATG